MNVDSTDYTLGKFLALIKPISIFSVGKDYTGLKIQIQYVPIKELISERVAIMLFVV